MASARSVAILQVADQRAPVVEFVAHRPLVVARRGPATPGPAPSMGLALLDERGEALGGVLQPVWTLSMAWRWRSASSAGWSWTA